MQLSERLALEREMAADTLFGASARIIGVDEVGRGCLAGPVVAAAVYFSAPQKFPLEMHALIRDSKTLSTKQRLSVYHHLRRSCTIAIASANIEEIDRLNILHASLLAMRRAIDKLCAKFSAPATDFFALIDGNQAPNPHCSQRCVIQGDQHCVSIAAASIVAKTVRDRLMIAAHHRHPAYGWNTNAGYGTPAHKSAIQQFGITPLHRRSFRPVLEAISTSSG